MKYDDSSLARNATVQPRAFDALVNWVEQGIPPDELVANRPASSSRPARTFLLCPYPVQARYKPNRGSVNDASAWDCRRYFHPKKNP